SYYSHLYISSFPTRRSSDLKNIPDIKVWDVLYLKLFLYFALGSQDKIRLKPHHRGFITHSVILYRYVLSTLFLDSLYTFSGNPYNLSNSIALELVAIPSLSL